MPPLLVFAYEFPHRKTQDFLLMLRAEGVRTVTVVGAPRVHLKHADDTNYFPVALHRSAPIDPKILCEALDFQFVACAHDDVEAIGDLIAAQGFRLGLISGARILKPQIIALLTEGVINIHPGKLPETAGLDAFYHAIDKGVATGATAHFIDGRVDAGDEILFEETLVGPDDTPGVLAENAYQSQLKALAGVLARIRAGAIDREPINRDRKNRPMEPDQKRAVLAKFPAWRSAQFVRQRGDALLRACEMGDLGSVDAILGETPGLIEHRNARGWSPLICASFNQHLDLMDRLLAAGADANGANRNGTSPLMYAKTKVLHQALSDYPAMKKLLAAGARLDHHDAHGRDIFHYVRAAGDEVMLAWLMARKDR